VNFAVSLCSTSLETKTAFVVVVVASAVADVFLAQHAFVVSTVDFAQHAFDALAVFFAQLEVLLAFELQHD
jgi:hypothetical protein